MVRGKKQSAIEWTAFHACHFYLSMGSPQTGDQSLEDGELVAFASVHPVVIDELNEAIVSQILEGLLELSNDVVVAGVALTEVGFEVVDIRSAEELTDLPPLPDGFTQFIDPCPTSSHRGKSYVWGQLLSMVWFLRCQVFFLTAAEPVADHLKVCCEARTFCRNAPAAIGVAVEASW